ncbi:hypothetical protein [Rhodoferax lacus]|nr:hypothetical protein [Rhodoferax lacus]
MISKHPDYVLVSTTFPMFGANIKRLWGSKEFKPYMKELIEAAQSGAKQGFPLDVLKALLRLEDLHGKLHPDEKPKMQDNEDFQKLSAVFPVMAQKIDTLWGGAEFAPYVSAVLQSSKGDDGAAFPFETLMSLHALIEKHNHDYAGQFAAISLWAA